MQFLASHMQNSKCKCLYAYRDSCFICVLRECTLHNPVVV